MVARFKVALLAALKAAPSITLEHFEPESPQLSVAWTTRQGEHYVVNPDAFFILRDGAWREGEQRRAFMLEADRSTMSLGRLMEKYRGYIRLEEDGLHHRAPFELPARFYVLTVARTADRASNILKAASVLPVKARETFLFTTEGSYRDAFPNVLAAIWRSAADPETRQGIIASPLPRAPA